MRRAYTEIKGFTLIEVTLYLFLFSIILTSLFKTIYLVLSLEDRLGSQIVVVTEGSYIVEKLLWGVSQAGNIEFTVNNGNVFLKINDSAASVESRTYSIRSGAFYLIDALGKEYSLSSSNVRVSDPVITITSDQVSRKFFMSFHLQCRNYSKYFEVNSRFDL